MPKLSDVIDVNINKNTVSIQGQPIPILFTMDTFNHVQKAYGKSYPIFERDLNKMLKDGGKVQAGNNEIKIMYSLIYGMIVSGGLECTLDEVRGGIPITDLQDIFQKVLDIFNNQDFQKNDLAKLKQGDKKK